MKNKSFILFLIIIITAAFLIGCSIGSPGNNSGSGSTTDTGGNTGGKDMPQTAAGYFHTLLLKTDGTVWSSGLNYEGQLGDNTTADKSSPIQVKGPDGTGYLTGIKAVAAANNYSMALKNDGTVWTWGSNNSGQLGNGTGGQLTDKSILPVQVVGEGGTAYLNDIIAIAAGEKTAFALQNNGTLWGWGDNWRGFLGVNRKRDIFPQSLTPVKVMDNVKTVASYVSITVALKNDGTVWMWGGSKFEISEDMIAPIQVKNAAGQPLKNIVSISVGDGFILALTQEGTVMSWGKSNGSGKLGNGKDRPDCYTPHPVLSQQPDGSTAVLTGVKAVSAGLGHSLALMNDGTMKAWGNNQNDQLYVGENTNTGAYQYFHFYPKTVGRKEASGSFTVLTEVASIYGGYDCTMVVKKDGTVWAWGENTHDRLGVGTYTGSNRLTLPKKVIF